MARGKIQIRRIENTTNRQVTYSKRRNGLLKKANELSVLCDARVSLIMISSTGKIQEYTSSSFTTKQLIDQYQRTLGIDIWSTHYERMQKRLKQLKEENSGLRRQIKQRMGECLNDLSYNELFSLEQEMEDAIKVVRERKYKVMSNQIDTTNKKLKQNKQMINRALQIDDVYDEAAHYGIVEHEASRLFGLSLQANQADLHCGIASVITHLPFV
ncbi:hypothetical protein UlMin_034155 [Ulmus minor]